MIISNFLPHTNIDEAIDGNSAFEKIKYHNYDIIIFDVNMPNTDSFGLISNILALKSDAKILMFSMNSEEIYAKRYLKMGAKGYVKKDAPETEIKSAIKTVLNNKSYVSPEMHEKLLTELQGNNDCQNPFEVLSPREFEIFQHLVRGDSLAVICTKLILHSSTVGTHKARILKKLNCTNVRQLSELAKVHNAVP